MVAELRYRTIENENESVRERERVVSLFSPVVIKFCAYLFLDPDKKRERERERERDRERERERERENDKSKKEERVKE